MKFAISIPDPIMLFAAVGIALVVCAILWLALEFRERSHRK
jgi:hypothetical protein